MLKNTENFGKMIKEVRKKLNLSQEDFARELGVSFTTVNRWENGKTAPSKLARSQFDAFFQKMIDQNKLKNPENTND